MQQQTVREPIILVVDDDESIRWVIAGLLQDVGYRVVEAKNGREALTYLRSTNELPALILLDLMMPVMNGREFRREQQRDALLKDIPVVVLSAGQNKRQATVVRPAAFLPKPFSANQLIEVVLRHTDALRNIAPRTSVDQRTRN